MSVKTSSPSSTIVRRKAQNNVDNIASTYRGNDSGDTLSGFETYIPLTLALKSWTFG